MSIVSRVVGRNGDLRDAIPVNSGEDLEAVEPFEAWAPGVEGGDLSWVRCERRGVMEAESMSI